MMNCPADSLPVWQAWKQRLLLCGLISSWLNVCFNYHLAAMETSKPHGRIKWPFRRGHLKIVCAPCVNLQEWATAQSQKTGKEIKILQKQEGYYVLQWRLILVLIDVDGWRLCSVWRWIPATFLKSIVFEHFVICKLTKTKWLYFEILTKKKETTEMTTVISSVNRGH